jgi:hypothetical protein
MTIRKAVEDLVKLGPLPESSAATEQDLDQRVALLKAIAAPVSDEEAAALAECFGPDECFGVAWSYLHLIETAPGGTPIKEPPPETANEWIRRLWARSHR